MRDAGKAMLEGWRGKRVLIVGKPDGLCAFLTAMLEEIGARQMRRRSGGCTGALPRADGGADWRGDSAGRDDGARSARTAGGHAHTDSGNPRGWRAAVLLALSDVAVYPSSAGKMNETAAIGGRTREGLEASILQMAILGAARGLTGDAVRTMLIRLRRL